MTQSEQKGRSILTNVLIVMVGQVGCLTLVIIMASVFGGLWLDNVFGTKPVITLALLFAGIPVSVIVMLAVARKTLARLKDKVENESNSSETSS
ncbi:MAG: AtpZ/AtpI family protein [Anaerolineales bacterium]|nr:AtpZ/AtpI family protein [Anaerolineales bacterium]NUQ86128.1 AtpZ/AtpI family protein [Anaerolineales bacterium]